MLTIFFAKLSNSRNQQVLSKGTKFQTCCYSNLRLVFCLQILDSSKYLGEKGRTFIKSKMLLVVKD